MAHHAALGNPVHLMISKLKVEDDVEDDTVFLQPDSQYNMAHRAALRNPVHPMVSRKKFPDDVEYDAVFSQPARLASQLLQTPQAVHYFLAIMQLAPRRSEKGPEGSKMQHTYHELRRTNDLQHSDYEEVKRTLEQVAETLTWVVRDMPHYGVMTRKHSSSASSTRCEISINKKFHETLLHARDGDEKLGLQFFLAVVMLHELAHATMCVLTQMSTEPIFGSHGPPEAGYEFTARLFGLCLFENELFSGELWWCQLVPSKDQRENRQLVEEVQISFIQELFTNEFWLFRFSKRNPWRIIPSGAWLATWSSKVCVPSSIKDLIRSAPKTTL